MTARKPGGRGKAVKRAPSKPLNVGFQDDGRLRSGDLSTLDRGRKLGMRSLRVIVPARDIKRGGGYDFSAYDTIVNNARARGVRPQLVLDTARDFSNGGDPAQYSRFVRAAARHFKGRVSRYSLINEPDLRMAPEKYRELYIRGRRGVKAVDPGAHILFGELSPRDPVDYTRRVVKRGGIRAEGVALHPYQFSSDPLAPGSEKGGIGRLGQIQRQLANTPLRTRMGRTPGLFLTEFGYHTRGGHAVPDDQAAAWWPRAIRKAQGAGARQLIAYHMSAESNPNSSWDTSLLNPDGSPRAAYGAVRAAIAASRRRR